MPQFPRKYLDILAGVALGALAMFVSQRHRPDDRGCPAWALYGTRGDPERRCFYARMASAEVALYCAGSDDEALKIRTRVIEDMRAEGEWRDERIAIMASLLQPTLRRYADKKAGGDPAAGWICPPE